MCICSDFSLARPIPGFVARKLVSDLARFFGDLSASSTSPAPATGSAARRRRSSQLASWTARELKAILREHADKHARYRQSRRFARALLKIWPALWTFAKHPSVQPTNNHAERALRGAVIYRKLSLGSQSEHGERRIARLLSAHTTCRLQRRSLHAYLIDALSAHARGDPAPLLA